MAGIEFKQIIFDAEFVFIVECLYYIFSTLQVFIVCVDYNERNDILEPDSRNKKDLLIRRATVRSLMDSLGKIVLRFPTAPSVKVGLEIDSRCLSKKCTTRYAEENTKIR